MGEVSVRVGGVRGVGWVCEGGWSERGGWVR